MTQSNVSTQSSYKNEPKTQNSENHLIWFRRDLRLDDNTALKHLMDVVEQTENVNLKSSSSTFSIKALFVVTAEQWLEHDMSLVQMDFIFRNLNQLATSLHNQLGIDLYVLPSSTYEDSIDQIVSFCQQHNITHVTSNYEYEVNEIKRDNIVSTKLNALNIEFNQYHDQCILPPNSVKTKDDTMYKVFTPFYKQWLSILETSSITLYDIPSKSDKKIVEPASGNNEQLTSILDTIKQLHNKTLRLFEAQRYLDESKNQTQLEYCRENFPAGEHAACKRLNQFIADDINDYDISRDQPALSATSKLSIYLAIGVISPRLCYLKAKKALEAEDLSGSSEDISRWISELAWRDFYRHVIVDRPDIVKNHAYKKETDKSIHWSHDEKDFTRWCVGKTGVPLVDAAMRCLNQTGFMHNRLRMVTAMFLTKDLLIDWRWGERYFMQQLIDGDFASNNGGWQWSASVGTDAAPYFRIMNPFSQGKTHDKNAVFIKSWLPELKSIPATILHDEAKLRRALSKEGDFSRVNYPTPMVNHKQARLYAIEQFKG